MIDQERGQLGAEIAHWRHAIAGLGDLEAIASPGAWAGLEQYLSLEVRRRLIAVVRSVELEGSQAAAALEGGADVRRVRRQVLRLRNRYQQAETILDFYGDAVNARTVPYLAATLRGLDRLATETLDMTLRPLGIDSPPVLVYIDKGLGASILRAGIRLWDQANPSPAAAIKLTRHNLLYPTALFHESGHQFAHLTGWTNELSAAFSTELGRVSGGLGEMWAGWASEVAADVYAFALAGWAPVPALANVVDGPTAAVYRRPPGDPHPFPLIRVLFNTAMCRSWFGSGPWDRVSDAWIGRHQPGRAPGALGALTRASLEVMPAIVDICTRRPMTAFKGRTLAAVADPNRVSPTSIETVVRRAGPSLLSSPYLARKESHRIVSWLSTRSVVDPANAPEHRRTLATWLERFGAETGSKAA